MESTPKHENPWLGVDVSLVAPFYKSIWRVTDMSVSHSPGQPEKGFLYNNSPRDTFYSDVSEEPAQEAVKLLQPQTMASFGTVSEPTSWSELPKIAAIAMQDKTLPVEVVQGMVDNAGDWLEVKQFETGHSPWMVIPEEFNSWLESAIDRIMEAGNATGQ